VDLWNFLSRNTSTSIVQYKKWLDVSSSHFSFNEANDQELRNVKSIIRRSKEITLESGRYLIFVSTPHHIEKDGKIIPLFLTPVSIDWENKTKELTWRQIHSIYYINQELNLNYIELQIEEVESWIDLQTNLPKYNIILKSPSLYQDLNHKCYIQRDLLNIQMNNLSSQVTGEMFNDKVEKIKANENPNFLSFMHVLPMDYSQGLAVEVGTKYSCHLIGPPGTGKSQTIINLAIQEMMLGKRIAILSQKKAALDVIDQRLDKLNLTSYCLNLMNDSSLNDFYHSIELCLEESLNYEQKEVSELYNSTYFFHCVRTLEDYFKARQTLINNRKKHNIGMENLSYLGDHPLFKIYYPNKLLIGLNPAVLAQEFNQLRKLAQTLKIPLDTPLGLLVHLEQPLYLISKIDFNLLKKLIKRKTLPIGIKKCEKERKKMLAQRPVDNGLSRIGKVKLEYYLDFLMSDQLIAKFFNSKAKEIVKEILLTDIDWNQHKVWNQIDKVKSALNYLDWKEQIMKLDEEENTIRLETLGGLESEHLKYILNKLEANLSVWKFIQTCWISERQFQPEKWLEVIHIVKKIINRNSDIDQVKFSMILDLELYSQDQFEQSEWDKLCSLNFNSRAEWNNFALGNHSSIVDFPVLKNYSRREIIEMTRFVRKHYNDFAQLQLSLGLNSWHTKRYNELQSLLKSRKSDSKTRREQWKSSIQFIQKRWSSKRSKPSLFQSISKLDLEFLLWLKPITVSSLDKFSQYIALKPELYDTIIIDEASQVELIDSIPALVRAKKVIIVGDGQQLTPSRFFKYQNFDFEQPHESLLELAQEKLPSTSLNYQYRAQFRELIQYSNTYFYQNSLNTTNNSSREAIKRVYLSEGVYCNRSNILEADWIVAELVKLISVYGTKKSIGIITFSIQQKETIVSKLEAASFENSELRAALNSMESKEEPFFVKSIEQVQGDERDIILISIGYAKNDHGKLYHFFGPILKHKGENRLNVLMSRSREKIIIITSLLSSEINVSPNSSVGLAMFKNLLSFIEQPISLSQKKIKKPMNYWEYILNPFKR
jgi:superfamily I DNA and/or RNA helicase